MREKEGYRDQLTYLRQRFDGRELVSVAEAADVSGCSQASIRNSKKLKKVKVGRFIRVPIVALAWWLCGD